MSQEVRRAEVREGCAVSTSLLASGLAHEVGSRVEAGDFSCCFAKRGGRKLLQIKVEGFVAKPDWKLRGGIPGKGREKEDCHQLRLGKRAPCVHSLESGAAETICMAYATEPVKASV